METPKQIRTYQKQARRSMKTFKAMLAMEYPTLPDTLLNRQVTILTESLEDIHRTLLNQEREQGR